MNKIQQRLLIITFCYTLLHLIVGFFALGTLLIVPYSLLLPVIVSVVAYICSRESKKNKLPLNKQQSMIQLLGIILPFITVSGIIVYMLHLLHIDVFLLDIFGWLTIFFVPCVFLMGCMYIFVMHSQEKNSTNA